MWLVVAAAAGSATAPGCGRWGFDPRPGASGDGGGGAGSGAGDGGGLDAGGGTAEPDAGSPTDCMVVTTPADEDDPGESAAPPHLGAGLSLREALVIANARAGRDCIHFDGAMTITIAGAALPTSTDADGLVIDGQEQVVLVGRSTPGTAGLDISAGSGDLRGVTVSQFAAGVRLGGAHNRVRHLVCRGNTEHGIQVAGAATDTEIVQTVLYDNGSDGIQALVGSDMRILHVTVIANGGPGINATGTVGLVLENSILAENTGAGLTLDLAATIDYDDFYGDTCDVCGIGSHSITSNPRITNPATGDFQLKAGSPAVDRGIDTGIDVNGAGAGLYDGSAPDLGAIESN